MFSYALTTGTSCTAFFLTSYLNTFAQTWIVTYLYSVCLRQNARWYIDTFTLKIHVTNLNRR